MSILDQEHVSAVFDIAPQLGLDPILMLAVVETETSGNRFLTRFEPNWKYFYKPEQFALSQTPRITVQTETNHQQTSWGLMQVMGSVARELNFLGHLPELTSIRIGLTLGMKQFLRVKRTGYSDDDNIAAYNAGGAYKGPNGLYVNQKYVDAVRSKWTLIKTLQIPNRL